MPDQISMATMPGLFVDPARPVNWASSLNRGLTGWWLVIPNSGWRGGLTFRNLTLKNHGTLTNMTVPSAWGGPRGRPGGFGRIIADGVNDYINVAKGCAIPTTYTIAAWVNLVGTQSDYGAIFAKTTDGTNPSYALQFNGPGVNLTTYHVSTAANLSITRASLQGTGWHHVAVTWDGALITSYLDGAGVAGIALSTAVGVGDANIYFMTERTKAYYLTGSLDDVRVYNRLLNSGELKKLYLESRQGYPDALNWVPLGGWGASFVGGGGATTNQALNVSASRSLSMSRGVGKVFLLSPATTPTILKQAGKNVLASAGAGATLTKAVGKLITGTAATTASTVRTVGKLLADTSLTTVSMVRSVGKLLSKTASTTVLLTPIRAFLLTLSVTSTGVATIRKSVGKGLSLGAAALASVTKGTTKTFSLSAAAADTLTKAVGKTLAKSASTLATLSAIRAILLTLSATAAASVSIRRTVGKGLNIVSGASSGFIRGIFKRLNVNASKTPSIASTGGLVLSVVLNATARTVATLSALFHTGAIIAVTLNASASALASMVRSILLRLAFATRRRFVRGAVEKTEARKPEQPTDVGGAVEKTDLTSGEL
jgi:hypothetical protein